MTWSPGLNSGFRLVLSIFPILRSGVDLSCESVVAWPHVWEMHGYIRNTRVFKKALINVASSIGSMSHSCQPMLETSVLNPDKGTQGL